MFHVLFYRRFVVGRKVSGGNQWKGLVNLVMYLRNSRQYCAHCFFLIGCLKSLLLTKRKREGLRSRVEIRSGEIDALILDTQKPSGPVAKSSIAITAPCKKGEGDSWGRVDSVRYNLDMCHTRIWDLLRKLKDRLFSETFDGTRSSNSRSIPEHRRPGSLPKRVSLSLSLTLLLIPWATPRDNCTTVCLLIR